MAERYSQEQLKEAFEKVQDKKDWKNPIKAFIDKTEDMVLIQQAVIHFTGTVADFTKINQGPNKGKVLVRAEGYRMGPCGDY